MRLRHAIALAVLPGICILARAQDPATYGSNTPPENFVSAWMRSGEPRLVAWGAFYALKMQDRAFVPDLVGVTRQWEALPHRDWEHDDQSGEFWDKVDQQREAEADVMATLIDMNASLDVDVLRRVAPDLPGPAVVMAARMPPEAVQGMLMEWFHLPVKQSDWYWNQSLQRTAAAMLALHPAPGFTAELLRDTHIWMIVAVMPPDGRGLWYGVSSDGGAGVGPRKPRADWPPPRYYFVRETYGKQDMGAVLIPGVDAVHFGLGTQFARGSQDRMWLDDRKRGRLIAQMLGVSPKELKWGQAGQKMIVYHSEDQYLAELKNQLTNEESEIHASMDVLKMKGLLSDEESRAAMPQVEVWLWDQRTKPVALLSLPSELEANVHFTKGEQTWSYTRRWDDTQ